MKTQIGLVVLASALLTSLSVLAQTPVAKGYAVGDVVPDFQVRNTDNQFVNLKNYANQKGVIVVFMANHCPFAKAYEDRLMAIHNRFAPQGFPILAVQTSDVTIYPEDAFEVVRSHARERVFSFPYTIDETQSVARAFGATRTPQVFLLTVTNGKFILRYAGAIDDNPQDGSRVQRRYLEEALTNVVNGAPVIIAETRPIGCAIKWK